MEVTVLKVKATGKIVLGILCFNIQILAENIKRSMMPSHYTSYMLLYTYVSCELIFRGLDLIIHSHCFKYP